jgi:Smg protein
MFEVLVYVYENYWRGDACPEPDQLQRKLNAVGFEADEIREALDWLTGLNLATRCTHWLPGLTAAVHPDTPTRLQSPHSMRVYSVTEQDHLGAECLGFIMFLESSGVLPSPMREIVIDRAMAVPAEELALDDLKIIVMMVYWSFGEEPDALILDELCDDTLERVAH